MARYEKGVVYSRWAWFVWVCPGWAWLGVGVSRVGVARPDPALPRPGLPNAGKSSVLNALLGRSAVGVSRAPGRTRYFQTHFLTPSVRLCDCPGLVFPSRAPPELQVRRQPRQVRPQPTPELQVRAHLGR